MSVPSFSFSSTIPDIAAPYSALNPPVSTCTSLTEVVGIYIPNALPDSTSLIGMPSITINISLDLPPLMCMSVPSPNIPARVVIAVRMSRVVSPSSTRVSMTRCDPVSDFSIIGRLPTTSMVGSWMMVGSR